MEYVITAEGLCKQYRHFKALDDFSIHIPKGSIYGLVGKNGAGKTTFIRLITGLQNPTRGTYTLYGEKNNTAAIEKQRKRMGAVVETPSLFLDMTARDNLIQQNMLLGNPDLDGADKLLKLVGLENTGDKKVRNFSLGMKQRLGIAVALSGNPDIIVLDEPINGLDPQGIVEIRELLLKLNSEMGITILVSSHILDELSRLATHYGFVDNGHLVREISADDLENACKKYCAVKAEKMNLLLKYADEKHIPYTVLNDNEAQFYDHIDINDIVLSLHKEGFRFLNVSEHEESLESFFINLVGGKTNG